MNQTELQAMDELYRELLEEHPESTNTYFTPSEDDMEAMFAEMGDD